MEDNQDNLNILRKIQGKSHITQRDLANELGFSLGKLNYCLKALKKTSLVAVYTDSTYVQKTMTQWLEGWKIKDYKIKGGKYRVNHDLWRELDALNQKHTIDWCWVKGHAGHPENERADALARKGVELVR